MNDKPIGRVHWSFWVIGAVTLLYNGAGVVNFITQMNPENVAAMPEGYRVLIESRPALATAAFAIAVFGGALGCLLLLLRKSWAYYLFIVSLLGAMVTMIQTLGMGGSDIAPVGAVIGNLVQLVVTVFLIWYSKWTERRGWVNGHSGMKTVSTIILIALIFLAVSSGITKVTLMQQDVDFFGRYGFSNPILIVYGLVQLMGGVMLAFSKTRFAGALIVAVTFLISLVVLLMEGNIPVSIATVVATLLLGVIMKQSWRAAPATDA